MAQLTYIVRRTTARLPQPAADPEFWKVADIARVDQWHPKSSEHRPPTTAQALYDDQHLYVLFRVRDRYVRCTRTEYQSLVSSDSCVEFFARPRLDKGYCNFELNCGGTMLLYYIEDPTRMPDRFFKVSTPVPEDVAKTIRIEHSLPRVVDPEITEPVDWWLQLTIPFAVFETYIGPVRPKPGDTWQGNFFKNGGDTSHPHWGSWSSIGQVLRFHQPEFFGDLKFG